MTDELAYHVRELRADLRLIQAEIEQLRAGRAEPLRAWTQAQALLDHDLEVHLPGALALMHTSMPPPAPADHSDDDAAVVSRHVGAALAALGDGPIPDAARVSTAAQAIDAASQIAALTVEQLYRSTGPPLR